MRRLLYVLIALAVFSSASSGLCTLPAGRHLSCDMVGVAHEDLASQRESGDSAMTPCPCCMPEAQGRSPESCSFNFNKCGSSPTASFQVTLSQGESPEAQDNSTGPRLEPKPWPLSWRVDSFSKALADPAGSTSSVFFASRARVLAEACRTGRSPLERLSRLSVFRI